VKVPRYSLDKVRITPGEHRAAAWAFARRAVRGTEYHYLVVDQNHSNRNQWEFIVRVPNEVRGRIEVRPLSVPNKKIWADLERRSLTFARAGMPAHASERYCQLSIPKPRGEGTRTILNYREKSTLPRWFRPLLPRMRRKTTIRRTRGTDGDALVVLVRPKDHATMIRLFLASKAWMRVAEFERQAM
jgi:hypothetical protein